MLRNRVGLLFVVVFVTFALTGCESKGPKTYAVSGNVTIDSAPLEKGQITFTSKDGKTASTGATVTNGKYSAQAQAGEYKVEITATRERGGIDPVMGKAPQEQYIAARFNTETTLEAKVTPEGPNQFDFPVSEK